MTKLKGGELISLVIFGAAFAALYGGDIYGMVKDWSIDDNYSHGYLIPVVSGYLLWQRREDVAAAALESRPTSWGIVPILVGLLVYLVGNFAGEPFTMRFSMLFVMAGTILFAYGMSLFRSVSFPFFYLIFMIPLPFIIYDSIAFPLKMFVTKCSVAALKILGIPVMREGSVITLVNTTLEVADACSGMRSLVSLLALATAFAYFAHKGWGRRAILVFMAIPIAIVANAVRVIGTGILASRIGAKAAQGFFHEFAGMVIFGVSMVMLMVTSFFLNRIGRNHE
uniref:Exosortase/archaeosortase family protein n=1 Tax=Geobacter metallireducens TaxID=28232 RepID=A0A831UDI1_GEOME